jgi:hypothetical protein
MLNALLKRFVVNEAIVEYACNDNEEGEEEELAKETGDDEFLACVECFNCTCCLNAAACVIC